MFFLINLPKQTHWLICNPKLLLLNRWSSPGSNRWFVCWSVLCIDQPILPLFSFFCSFSAYFCDVSSPPLRSPSPHAQPVSWSVGRLMGLWSMVISAGSKLAFIDEISYHFRKSIVLISRWFYHVENSLFLPVSSAFTERSLLEREEGKSLTPSSSAHISGQICLDRVSFES